MNAAKGFSRTYHQATEADGRYQTVSGRDVAPFLV